MIRVKTATTIALMLLVTMASCSQLPDPPDPPELSASTAAGKAMELYDANGDGQLDAEELKKSPPLLDTLPLADKNSDGSLSESEIKNRIDSWFAGTTTIDQSATMVSLDDEPLVGATVTYIPEPFLEPAIQQTSGVTDEQGLAETPGQDPEFPGLYFGWYRVKISKLEGGEETLPSRYNTETELAREICGLADRRGTTLIFKLTSN